MKKVLIAGTFDIIHPGHINLIKQALGLGDFLVIVLAREQNVIKVKGHPPYFNEAQRLKNLQELLSKNSKNQIPNLFKIILGDVTDPYKIINEEKPDIIALGYDQERFVDGLNKWIRDTRYEIQVTRLKPFKENVCKGKNIRKAIENSQSGFLLINKDELWTSHDAVAKLRSIIGIKQIGHTGTLDPFATGLLICAVSEATKMVEIFNVLPKTYEATIRFGVVSDTYDRTGIIQNSQPKAGPPLAENSKIPSQRLVRLPSARARDESWRKNFNSKVKIEEVLKSFIGKQQQLPPMYSAKKIQGRKLYELARKGKEVERKPSNIEIYSLEFLGIRNQELEIRVKCSAGTYIRTLANDIGQKLRTGAILEELKRTAIGDFNASQAVQLNQITQNNYSNYLIKPLAALEAINTAYFKQG